MGRLHVVFVLLLGGDWISGSVLDVTVRSGENITLYCDCENSTKDTIMWYRNCTHGNQPPLVLKLKDDPFKPTSDRATLVALLPRFRFIKNQSSGSYDLLLMNISDSDEGLYYCGTEQPLSEGKENRKIKYVYRYGSIKTRILIKSSDTTSAGHQTLHDCSMCWKLLFILCPAVLATLLVSLLVHHICQKTVGQQKPESSEQPRSNQDEDVLYATVETHQTTQRPKKKTSYNSDFCTYSAINTSGV